MVSVKMCELKWSFLSQWIPVCLPVATAHEAYFMEGRSDYCQARRENISEGRQNGDLSDISRKTVLGIFSGELENDMENRNCFIIARNDTGQSIIANATGDRNSRVTDAPIRYGTQFDTQ